MRTEIIITNRIDSGTTFAVTTEPNAEAVFVPAKVADSVRAEVGDRYIALLVPNVLRPDKTPWMAARLDPALPFDPVESPPQESVDAAQRVKELLRAGGVWTVLTLFKEIQDDSPTYPQAIERIKRAVEDMHARGECAKFQLWRSPDRPQPDREWYTCHPERADVDEWADEVEA